jgi:hypothetical protein
MTRFLKIPVCLDQGVVSRKLTLILEENDILCLHNYQNLRLGCAREAGAHKVFKRIEFPKIQ